LAANNPVTRGPVTRRAVYNALALQPSFSIASVPQSTYSTAGQCRTPELAYVCLCLARFVVVPVPSNTCYSRHYLLGIKPAAVVMHKVSALLSSELQHALVHDNCMLAV
jgi:hypothetical protein